MSARERPPDGIHEEHARHPRLHRHASPLALLVFVAIVAAAFTGVFGREAVVAVPADGALATWDAPVVLRNGEFFEMELRVLAQREIADLAFGIDASYWRDVTINTFIPAPTEERGEGGELRFTFGRLAAGEELVVKIDGQVNPAHRGTSRGALRLYDGEEFLGERRLELAVRP